MDEEMKMEGEGCDTGPQRTVRCFSTIDEIGKTISSIGKILAPVLKDVSKKEQKEIEQGSLLQTKLDQVLKSLETLRGEIDL